MAKEVTCDSWKERISFWGISTSSVEYIYSCGHRGAVVRHASHTCRIWKNALFQVHDTPPPPHTHTALFELEFGYNCHPPCLPHLQSAAYNWFFSHLAHMSSCRMEAALQIQAASSTSRSLAGSTAASHIPVTATKRELACAGAPPGGGGAYLVRSSRNVGCIQEDFEDARCSSH